MSRCCFFLYAFFLPTEHAPCFSWFLGSMMLTNPSSVTVLQVVVYYTATWCMPCQQIRPKVDQLSMQYQNVSFVKVDIDELAEVAQFAGVRSVPTFEFYKKGTRVASFAGADVGKLEAFVKQHQVAGASSSSSSSGSSSTGGNGSTDGIANGMVRNASTT